MGLREAHYGRLSTIMTTKSTKIKTHHQGEERETITARPKIQEAKKNKYLRDRVNVKKYRRTLESRPVALKHRFAGERILIWVLAPMFLLQVGGFEGITWG